MAHVVVQPRYTNSGDQKVVPSMLEVTFTRKGGLQKHFLQTEKEYIRSIMQDSDVKQCVINYLEPYRWESLRICTRNRTTDVSHEYVWKIERTLPLGRPSSLRKDY